MTIVMTYKWDGTMNSTEENNMNGISRMTYSSLIHLFLSSGRAYSRSDCKVISSEWRLDNCWTMPGTDTYVDEPAWASENSQFYMRITFNFLFQIQAICLSRCLTWIDAQKISNTMEKSVTIINSSLFR